MKIEKWTRCYGFQRTEKTKKKVVGRRAAEGGDRCRTRINRRLEQRNSSEPTTRVVCKPGLNRKRELSRISRPATAQRQAHVRLATGEFPRAWPAHPQHCWRMSARGTTILACLLSVCPIFVSVLVIILFLRE